MAEFAKSSAAVNHKVSTLKSSVWLTHFKIKYANYGARCQEGFAGWT